MSNGAGESGSFVLAFIPGAVIVVLTFFMFQQAIDRQRATLNAVSDSEAGWVQERLERGLDRRAAALERLAAARAEGGDAWRDDALALTTGATSFRAVLDYDTTLAMREVVPEGLRLLSTLDPRDEAARKEGLHVATASAGREAVTLATAPLASGERQVLVCAPVMRGRVRVGWVVGLARLRDLLDADLARSVGRGFSVGVYEGATLLYGASTAEGGPGARYVGDAAVLRGPLLWRVQVWPAEELARQYESWAPRLLFVAGMLLAFFVALSVYLSRRTAG